MAKSQKELPSPSVFEINPPPSLIPIMQAFHVETEEAANALIQEAAMAIAPEGFMGRRENPSKSEIEIVASLMRGLKPQDSIETLYAAQVIVSHMVGMRKLASDYPDDQRIGLKMLKFSNEAIQQLDRKRIGRTQNIIVNYNRNGVGDSYVQTVIKEKQSCQSKELSCAELNVEPREVSRVQWQQQKGQDIPDVECTEVTITKTKPTDKQQNYAKKGEKKNDNC